MYGKFWIRAALLGAILAVSACDTAEERSRAHHQRGIELVEAGEPEKAALEFRNAIRLDDDAPAPRLALANVLSEQGALEEAAGHYLAVADLQPENFEAHFAAGRILLALGAVDQAREHVEKSLELKGEDADAKALVASLRLREGRTETAKRLAQDVLSTNPGHISATIVMASLMIRNETAANALGLLEISLKDHPRDLGLHLSKIQTLQALNDTDGLSAHLKVTARTFPDNLDLALGVARWQQATGDLDGAEKTLRDIAARFPDDPSHALNVVEFIGNTRGEAAARAELETLIATGQHQTEYALAVSLFDLMGDNFDVAIERLQGLLTADLPKGDLLKVRTQLANAYRLSGQDRDAEALISEVLSEDARNVEALKLRSIYTLRGDDMQAAITDLRTALELQPGDPVLLTLLAQAHERSGSRDLARDRLGQAVIASGYRPDEVIRHAEFLIRDGRPGAARQTLEDAVKRKGEDPVLLEALIRSHAIMNDWRTAEGLARRLLSRDPENADAQALLDRVRVQSLSGVEQFDLAIGTLREIWDKTGETSGAMEALVSRYVEEKQPEAAMEFLDAVLAEDDTNLRALLLKAAVHSFLEDADAAEATYREVVGHHPGQATGYGSLAALLASQGRSDEADAVLLEGIENAENVERLLMARAQRLEETGDFTGAIAIYQKLYDANKASDILVNNLASLLSEHVTEPDGVERAYRIAQRISASDIPHFQDTWGWILYLRGEYDRALRPLRNAADQLPDNALVQMHLGLTYQKLGKTDLARVYLEKGIALSEGSILPQRKMAEAALMGLKTE